MIEPYKSDHAGLVLLISFIFQYLFHSFTKGREIVGASNSQAASAGAAVSSAWFMGIDHRYKVFILPSELGVNMLNSHHVW